MITKEYNAEALYPGYQDKRPCIEGIRARAAERLKKAIAKQKRVAKKQKISNIQEGKNGKTKIRR